MQGCITYLWRVERRGSILALVYSVLSQSVQIVNSSAG